ncbi:hypothetical protein FSP39_023347 [Pinctada imbricata]|uniref:S-formylglutathione hydrolase n=1 Tax=Pinctada imbricata TaxID=66713 RepID=A0AA88YAJ7_PINIB|nr:hypothetical protein FSP39_023347 [Pinctada imbricata]
MKSYPIGLRLIESTCIIRCEHRQGNALRMSRICLYNDKTCRVMDKSKSQTRVHIQRSMMASNLVEKSKNKMFGGYQHVYTHDSPTVNCKMTFGIYLPPQAENDKVPVVYWLSGGLFPPVIAVPRHTGYSRQKATADLDLDLVSRSGPLHFVVAAVGSA